MIPGANSVGQVGLLRNDALGDTLLVLPAATAIKRYDRNIRVELVCDPAYVDLLRAHPDLDEVIADPGGKAGELARTLRSRRYDALLVLRPTPRNAWAALLARVPLRIGTGYRAYSILFNRRWFGHRRTNLKHEAEYNLELVRRLISKDPGPPQYYLSPPPEERDGAMALLDETGLVSSRPMVAIHPGSRGSALAWPVERFARLAAGLRQEGLQVAVTGLSSESDLTAPVAAVEGVVDLTGRTTLGQLAWVYKYCDCMVANSTGTLHLAAAVGTKVVGIYPAAEINSPVRWGPFGPGHKTFRGPVDNCPKCIGTECPVYNCLELLAVEDVLRVVKGVAAQSPHHGRWPGSPSSPAPAGARSAGEPSPAPENTGGRP